MNDKLLNKKVLFFLNIILAPFFAIIFDNFISYLIPKVIYESDHIILAMMLQVFYSSLLLSVVSIVILIMIKNDRIKSILAWTIPPVIISVLLSPITIPMFGMLVYGLYCLAGSNCSL